MSDQQFKKAAEVIQGLPKNAPVKVSQDMQLKVYALYKQATVGDVNTSRPGMLDMTGRYKWDAWNKVKGKSAEDAKKEYVDTFYEIFEPYKGKWVHSDADDAEYAKYLEEVKSLA